MDIYLAPVETAAPAVDAVPPGVVTFGAGDAALAVVARRAGAVRFALVDPGGNNAALAVAVLGEVVTVNLATDGAGAVTTTNTEVIAAVRASAAARALVDVRLAAGAVAGAVVAAAAVANVSGGWVLAARALHQGDGAVTVAHGGGQEFFMGSGAADPLSGWRTEDSLTVEVDVADASVSSIAMALGVSAPVEVAAGGGVPGTRTIALERALGALPEHALLARGPSAHNQALVRQLYIPRAVLYGDPSLQYRARGGPAMVKFMLRRLQSPSPSQYVDQTAAAL